MYAWNLQVACILTLYTYIYIHMCMLHSYYRWDFGRHKSLAVSFSTHFYMCEHVHIAERLSLSCILGATIRWHSLCTCTCIYIYIIYICMYYFGSNLKKLTGGHEPSPSASSMPPKQKQSVLLHERPELLQLGLKFVRHGIF